MISTRSIEKQLYQFIITKNKSFLALPSILRKQSRARTTITVNYLIPIMSQNTIQTKPKQLIVELITDILKNSQASVEQTVSFFNASNKERQQQLQIVNEVTLLTILSKSISIPTYLLNLINDAKLSIVTISPIQIQHFKKDLYNSILAALQHLSIEDKLVVINRLLTLKQQQIVLSYLLKTQSSFVGDHFNDLSKQANIIRTLYKRYIIGVQSQQRLIVKHLLTEIANRYQNSTQSFVALLNFNQHFYYSGQRYKQFYYLLNPTRQGELVLRQILQWWAVSKQFIITSVQAKVRCNILAMAIDNIEKEELYSKSYLVSITEGIKKRLTDGSSKDFASLIWKVLGKKIQMKLTEEIQKANYFIIQSIPKEQVQYQKTLPSATQSKPLPVTTQTQEKYQGGDEKKEQRDGQQADLIQIEPKNIYDCILGLKNAHRRDRSLKKLSQLIKKHKQDLVLMWNTLLRELLCPIQQQYIPILAELLSYRPEGFVQSAAMYFMAKQSNISEKTYLMEIIKLGIEELSTTQDSSQEQDQPFYFKKVRSTYYRQSQHAKQQEKSGKKQERTRRWGHTRIAHERSKGKDIRIDFIKKEQSINRFYPVSNLLYFKIIDVFTINIIQNLRAHQVYVHSLLKLIAVFVANIKNHMDKYLILTDITQLCSKIIAQLVDNSKNSTNRYQETGGLTLMLTLQVLNKVSLVIDQFTTQNVLLNLKSSIEGSKKLPNYGMSSVIGMVQSNIYKKLYTNQGNSFF